MAIIKCKMCGGDIELSADKTFGVCECCGSTMTFPKIDDDQRVAAFNRGNYFRRIGEFDKALAVYERIVEEDNTDAEAHWCYALCRYGIEYVEDPTSHEYLPTCHRASFDNFLEDVDYQAALQYSDGITKRQYEKDAAKIAEVQHGILATCQNEQPFDVFICYKESDENGSRTKDSTLAQEIYYQLTDQGRRVFFARITLEDKAGTEYEPYIFAALNSAKVMVVVGTKPEYFNAVWVKNEWSRFLAMMKKDRSKLLLPCYRDMDPYDLPEALAVLQSYDMSKIGFIQDLTRGIDKILFKDTPTRAVQKQVIVSGGAESKVSSLLERGMMALEDADWVKADNFFEEVLNNDAKNAQAYLGKALAQEKCRNPDALVKKRLSSWEQPNQETLTVPKRSEHIDLMVKKCTIPDFVDKNEILMLYEFDRNYLSDVSGRQTQYQAEQRWWNDNKLLNRAEKFADPTTADLVHSAKQKLLTQLEQRVEVARTAESKAVKTLENAYDAAIAAADNKAQELYKKGAARREQTYQAYCEQVQKEIDPEKLAALADNFTKLRDYKESSAMAEQCLKKAKEEQVRKQLYKKEKHKKIGIISGIAIASLAVIAVLSKQLLIPMVEYNKAEKLLESGQYQKATMAFVRAGNYRDAKQRVNEYWDSLERAQNAISAGENHTVGLKSDGTVVAIGKNDYGQCDVDTWENIVAVSAGDAHTVGLKSDGTVIAAGWELSDRCDVSAWKNIKAISAGGMHTVGLKSDGTVVAVGRNVENQCDVSDWRDIIAVSAGYQTTVGLKSDGTVIATGTNQFGQCNVEDWQDIVAVSAGSTHTVGLKSDGTVVAVGQNSANDCDVKGWKNIVAISVGDIHTVGLKSDGTVVAAGRDEFGQCDVKDWQDIVAISAGDYNTFGLKSDGTVVSTGCNTDGECNVSDWTSICVSDGNG